MPTGIVTNDGTRWSNAAEDRIELVEPDPAWPHEFSIEAHALRSVLPDSSGLRIEHFGSTAIPGLRAKPIIDILIVHPDRDLWPPFIDAIASLGYVFWAENPRRDRLFFVKGMPPFGSRRTHHVHVRVPADASAELRFRDTLRGSPTLAREYAELKDQLAIRYANDRDGYTNAKTEFVGEVLSGAGRVDWNAV